MIDLRGLAIDESGVKTLKINGSVVPLNENGNFVMWLNLSAGSNKFTIEAIDVNDNIALKKIEINRRDLEETYDAANAKNYLVAIGINNYTRWPKLNNAVRDIEDIKNTLLTKYRFEEENTVFITDSAANRNNILSELRSLIEKVGPQDNLLIYYSGHGYFDDLLSEGYWVPFDASLKNTGDFIPNSSVLKIIQNINSKHTFLVVDACFSGSLFADSHRGYTENVEQFKSRWGLVSGRLEKVSDGSSGKNSPFATAFIEYLNNENKEKFAVSELVTQVKIKVAESTNQTPLGNPLKVAGDEGGEFIFYKK